VIFVSFDYFTGDIKSVLKINKGITGYATKIFSALVLEFPKEGTMATNAFKAIVFVMEYATLGALELTMEVSIS
jgi:hypothetical protein